MKKQSGYTREDLKRIRGVSHNVDSLTPYERIHGKGAAPMGASKPAPAPKPPKK